MIFRKNNFVILVLVVLIIVSIIIISRSKKRPEQIAPSIEKEIVEEKKIIANVAIAIDDLGYNLNNLPLIYTIKRPLTLSILPNTPYSKKIAYEAARHGYEIILHLPLEPHGKDEPLEVDTICVDMSEKFILEKLSKAFNSVPTLKGISNHMGSKATEHVPLMRIIFKELKKRQLYFLDNLVTEGSVCEEISKEIGIGFAKRDVYLDNIAQTDYIKSQFRLLIEKAKDTGTSIGVGHDRPLTIEVLAEEIPKAEDEGIEFVFVSDLVK